MFIFGKTDNNKIKGGFPMPGFAFHEKADLHELLNFKTTCVAKSKTMLGFTSDPVLVAFLKQDIDTSTRHITELQHLIGTMKVTM
jgi:similar to spore coat protein